MGEIKRCLNCNLLNVFLTDGESEVICICEKPIYYILSNIEEGDIVGNYKSKSYTGIVKSVNFDYEGILIEGGGYLKFYEAKLICKRKDRYDIDY